MKDFIKLILVTGCNLESTQTSKPQWALARHLKRSKYRTVLTVKLLRLYRIILLNCFLNKLTGFELVKQNRFAKISEGNKEKGPEQAKVFFGSTNHFMKNATSFKFLQANLVTFCEFNSVFLCLRNYKQGLLEAHKSNLEINHKRTMNVVVCKNSKND